MNASKALFATCLFLGFGSLQANAQTLDDLAGADRISGKLSVESEVHLSKVPESEIAIKRIRVLKGERSRAMVNALREQIAQIKGRYPANTPNHKLKKSDYHRVDELSRDIDEIENRNEAGTCSFIVDTIHVGGVDLQANRSYDIKETSYFLGDVVIKFDMKGRDGKAKHASLHCNNELEHRDVIESLRMHGLRVELDSDNSDLLEPEKIRYESPAAPARPTGRVI